MQNINLALVAFVCLFGTSLAADCFGGVQSCADGTFGVGSCTTRFGSFPEMNWEAETLVEKHMKASIDYLFMGSRFNEWKVNRKGFSGYFNKLSDAKWEQTKDLLKYMISRGGELTSNFSVLVSNNRDDHVLDELPALGKALDTEKAITNNIQHLAHRASVHTTNHNYMDGAFYNFLSEDVAEHQIPRIQDLSRHVHTLSSAMKTTKDTDSAFVLYLYDTNVINK